jgi:hypothetical protein
MFGEARADAALGHDPCNTGARDADADALQASAMTPSGNGRWLHES